MIKNNYCYSGHSILGRFTHSVHSRRTRCRFGVLVLFHSGLVSRGKYDRCHPGFFLSIASSGGIRSGSDANKSGLLLAIAKRYFIAFGWDLFYSCWQLYPYVLGSLARSIFWILGDIFAIRDSNSTNE